MYAVRTIVYGERTVILDADPRIACGFDEVELMMACPIPDKNGRQLFESDLVNVDYSGDIRTLKIALRRDFGWDVVDPLDSETSDFILDEDSRFLELVGNVYENQEPSPPSPPVITPAVPYGDKKKAILAALPALLTGEPMTGGEIARKLDFPVSEVYVYLLLKKQPNVRSSEVVRAGRIVTGFELIPLNA